MHSKAPTIATADERITADRLRLAPVPPPLEISAKFPDTAVSLHRCRNALRQPYEATDMLAVLSLAGWRWTAPSPSSPHLASRKKQGALGTADSGGEAHCR